MKKKQALKNWSIFITSLFFSIYSFAQDKKVDINISTDKSSNWYAEPWVWIVGGAVFILLLVALLRNNKSTN